MFLFLVLAVNTIQARLSGEWVGDTIPSSVELPFVASEVFAPKYLHIYVIAEATDASELLLTAFETNFVLTRSVRAALALTVHENGEFNCFLVAASREEILFTKRGNAFEAFTSELGSTNAVWTGLNIQDIQTTFLEPKGVRKTPDIFTLPGVSTRFVLGTSQLLAKFDFSDKANSENRDTFLERIIEVATETTAVVPGRRSGSLTDTPTSAVVVDLLYS